VIAAAISLWLKPPDAATVLSSARTISIAGALGTPFTATFTGTCTVTFDVAAAPPESFFRRDAHTTPAAVINAANNVTIAHSLIVSIVFPKT
jgi:hypothetical protein